jgi:hypothetical protein
LAGGKIGAAGIEAEAKAGAERKKTTEEVLQDAIAYYRGPGDNEEYAQRLELLLIWRNDPDLARQFQALTGGTGLEQYE